MSAVLERPLTVAVPATSANLGPGFDCLGLALTLENTFTFAPAPETDFSGCPPRFADTHNLAWRTFNETRASLGLPPQTVALSQTVGVPLSGGLGSSSTCIVAGVAAGLASAGLPWDREETLRRACAIEGHPDNVAPAVCGGLTASFVTEGEVTCLQSDVAPEWRFVVVSPPYEVRTEDARRALPATVAHADAARQLGRCFGVVRALERGDGALLGRASHDRLHEPYRRPLIRDYDACREACLDAGACAFWISGSGSSMVAACLGDASAANVLAAVPDGLPVRVLRAQTAGTSIAPCDV